jgi:hypothetical protein
MSIGHEFRRRTLDVLLAQPTSRPRILAAKLGVLAAMLAVLTALAWTRVARGSDHDWWLLFPSLVAVTLAPALTMIARSELGGMALAGAIPAYLWLGGQVAGVLKYGASRTRAREIATLQATVFELGMLAVVGVGAIGCFMLFRRLETAGGFRIGARRSLGWLSRRGSEASGRRKRPTFALISKELRLYGLPLALAGLYAASWILITSLESAALQLVDVVMLTRGLAGVYVAMVTLLVASIASAEERQLGTLPSETLLPTTNRHRWLVKAVCAASVALALGIVLPVALATWFPGATERLALSGWLLGNWRHGGLSTALFGGFAGLVGVFAISLYVSSLSTGGLRALLASIATVAMIPIAMNFVAMLSLRGGQWLTQSMGLDSNSWLTRFLVDDRLHDRLQLYTWMPMAFAGGLMLLVLHYASQNHASFERPAAALSRQATRLAVFVIVAVATLTFVSGLTSAAFMARWTERVAAERAAEQQKSSSPSPAQQGTPNR